MAGSTQEVLEGAAVGVGICELYPAVSCPPCPPWPSHPSLVGCQGGDKPRWHFKQQHYSANCTFLAKTQGLEQMFPQKFGLGCSVSANCDTVIGKGLQPPGCFTLTAGHELVMVSDWVKAGPSWHQQPKVEGEIIHIPLLIMICCTLKLILSKPKFSLPEMKQLGTQIRIFQSQSSDAFVVFICLESTESSLFSRLFLVQMQEQSGSAGLGIQERLTYSAASSRAFHSRSNGAVWVAPQCGKRFSLKNLNIL